MIIFLSSVTGHTNLDKITYNELNINILNNKITKFRDDWKHLILRIDEERVWCKNNSSDNEWSWTLRKLERKYLESFEMWCWRGMEKIKWSERVTNEQVLDRIGEKRTLLNNSWDDGGK